MTLRLGFFTSHQGSNMQAIINACKQGIIDGKPCVVISNNSDAEALARARREGIPAYHFSSKTIEEPGKLDETILETLRKHEIELVVLAGYMKQLGEKTLTAFEG